jgi:hypothetical protein
MFDQLRKARLSPVRRTLSASEPFLKETNGEIAWSSDLDSSDEKKSPS